MWGILEYFFVVLLILIEILYCNSNISRFVCIVVSQVTEVTFTSHLLTVPKECMSN